MKRGLMTKATESDRQDELRPEYDFAQMAGGIRGKYVSGITLAQT
mgnify:CR=1 FL=1